MSFKQGQAGWILAVLASRQHMLFEQDGKIAKPHRAACAAMNPTEPIVRFGSGAQPTRSAYPQGRSARLGRSRSMEINVVTQGYLCYNPKVRLCFALAGGCANGNPDATVGEIRTNNVNKARTNTVPMRAGSWAAMAANHKRPSAPRSCQRLNQVGKPRQAKQLPESA